MREFNTTFDASKHVQSRISERMGFWGIGAALGAVILWVIIISAFVITFVTL